MFKEPYPDTAPNWAVWGAEFEGDDEDWEQSWGLVEEDEWFDEPVGEDADDDQDGELPDPSPPIGPRRRRSGPL